MNGDGSIDLVVGAPGQNVGGVTDQGRVFVFFGPWSPTNSPPYANWAYLDVDPGEVSTGTEPGGEFGTSVAVGDLNLNTWMDVVVGAPHATYALSGGLREPDVGGADVFLDLTGDQGLISHHRYKHLFQPDVSRAASNLYGQAVGVGQFAIDFQNQTNETWPDVVVGAPGRDETGSPDVGYVQYHFGHTDGLGKPVWDTTQPWRQGTSAIYHEDNGHDHQFGWALAVVDHDGDGWDDVIAGAPGRPTDRKGYIALLRGSARGVWWITDIPHDRHDVTFDPNAQGPPYGSFGSSLAWLDTDNSGYLDIAIGAPTLVSPPGSSDQGGVYLAYGQSGSLDRWTIMDPPYLDPTPTASEQFGFCVARSLRFGTATLDDLVIGAPHAAVPGRPDAGEVFVFNH